MKPLTMEALALLIASGSVTRVRALPPPMEAGWYVVADHSNNLMAKELVTTRNDLRIFASADTLLASLGKAGWLNAIEFIPSKNKR